MHVSRLVAIFAGSVNTNGRCRACGKRITWAIRMATPGRPAKPLPFDGRPFPLRVERNDDTGVIFEWWSVADLHFRSCTNPPPRRTRPGTPAHP